MIQFYKDQCFFIRADFHNNIREFSPARPQEPGVIEFPSRQPEFCLEGCSEADVAKFSQACFKPRPLQSLQCYFPTMVTMATLGCCLRSLLGGV